jgi:hypothetical protein
MNVRRLDTAYAASPAASSHSSGLTASSAWALKVAGTSWARLAGVGQWMYLVTVVLVSGSALYLVWVRNERVPGDLLQHLGISLDAGRGIRILRRSSNCGCPISRASLRPPPERTT